MFVRALSVSLCLVLMTLPVRAETKAPDAKKIAEANARGIKFLKSTQAEDGSWTSPKQLGISGLVVYSLLRAGVPADDPAVAKALKHLESFSQPDGGLYAPETRHKNYETSIIMMALREANKDGRYDEKLKKGVEFVKGIQWDEGEQIAEEDPLFGGQGYGRGRRPDLSNTTFFVEALHSAGVSADDPAMKKALVFVSRCQNLEGEANNTPFAAIINDGGFYYTPCEGGQSPAGKTPEGGLRSYASMTYAGLKSMLYAGLTKDDPRVKAASEWIRQHYTLEENPGMAQQGLYYFLMTYGKTMEALGGETFEDAKGVAHPWRSELSERLFGLQKENGSWLNTNDRWMEGDPNLITGYALIALSHCQAAESSK